MLKRLLSKEEGKLWGFNGNDKSWRDYMGKVVYWELSSIRASELVREFAEGHFTRLLTHKDPMKYFREMQKEHIAYAFHEFKKELVPGMQQGAAPYLENTARRLAYRY